MTRRPHKPTPDAFKIGVERMSKRQRERTPFLLALHLAAIVQDHFGADQIAALWVRDDTEYKRIPGVDCWPRSRDAFNYSGPHPIIAHPPCGPWGNYRHKCHGSIDDAIRAMEYVHRFGGVVEHPFSSPLFDVHGKGGHLQTIDQSNFGFRAVKKTRLYWYLPPTRLAATYPFPSRYRP